MLATSRPTFAGLIACAAVGCWPCASLALEYSAAVGYDGRYTNNAGREAGSRDSDIVHEPHIDVTAVHIGPATSVGLDYRARRRIYQDDTFREETILEGSGNVLWNAIPQRLSFHASNSRREAEINRSGDLVPTNLQESDNSVVGATLTLDSFSNHYMAFQYAYSQINFADTINDSERQSVSASYTIPLSVISQISVQGSGTRVEFDEPLAPGYDSLSQTIQYSRQTSKFFVSANLGRQEIDREQNRDTVDGVVGGLTLSRQLSELSRVGLSYNQSFRDNSLNFGRSFITEAELDQIEEIINGDQLFLGDTDISEVYREQQLALNYNTAIGVNSFGLSLFGSRQDYEDVARDTDSVGARMELGRALRKNVDATLGLSYRRHEFVDEDREDDEARAQFSLAWQRTPRLSLGLGLYYYTRDRNQIEETNRVNEWAGSVSINYRLIDVTRR